MDKSVQELVKLMKQAEQADERAAADRQLVSRLMQQNQKILEQLHVQAASAAGQAHTADPIAAPVFQATSLDKTLAGRMTTFEFSPDNNLTSKVEMKALQIVFMISCLLIQAMICSNILMVTMGGNKSHKTAFSFLAKSLMARNHNVTFLSGFPAEYQIEGMEEIAPAGLVSYLKNFMNRDFIGDRMNGENPTPPADQLRYGYESCESLLEDQETQDFLHSRRSFDLIILDGAFPECALGFVYYFKKPFMYINTIGTYVGSLMRAGNPSPYSVTPFFVTFYSDNMNIFQRTANIGWHVASTTLHSILMNFFLQRVLRKHFGPDIPHVYDLSKNVSFILQNGHYSLTYPKPFLPNVAEVACMNCQAPEPLEKELENFVNASGDAGFVFVSLGTVPNKMPPKVRRIFIRALSRLSQRVLWKYDGDAREIPELPPNIMIKKWLPQQNLLGHKNIRAFVTHAGSHSISETVFHGVPIVTIPIFCDQNAYAAKAELDGYGRMLEFETLTSDNFYEAIIDVIHNPKYRKEAKKRQRILKDVRETPLDTAVYWTEYVIRHEGAYHLQPSWRHYNFFQYYMLDVFILVLIAAYALFLLTKTILSYGFKKVQEMINHVVKFKNE